MPKHLILNLEDSGNQVIVLLPFMGTDFISLYLK